MRKLLVALAATASFGALAAHEESDTEGARPRLTATLAHRAQLCPSQFDGDAASGELINAQMPELVADTAFRWAYAIASNGLTACVDSRLRNMQLEDGRSVIASLHLGEGRVRLNPKAESDEALDMAGKGVAEALKQIQMRGGPRPPAHMLVALAVVEDRQSASGFTIVPNDRNVLKAFRPAAAP